MQPSSTLDSSSCFPFISQTDKGEELGHPGGARCTVVAPSHSRGGRPQGRPQDTVEGFYLSAGQGTWSPQDKLLRSGFSCLD